MCKFHLSALISGVVLAGLGGAPSLAQPAGQTLLTCRSVLEVGKFSAARDGETTQCCFVADELEWYASNNILPDQLYRVGDVTAYTKSCESAALDASTPNTIDQQTTGNARPQSGMANNEGVVKEAGAGNTPQASGPNNGGEQIGASPQAAGQDNGGEDKAGDQVGGNAGGQGNNGKGNGGRDGSPNGKEDVTR